MDGTSDQKLCIFRGVTPQGRCRWEKKGTHFIREEEIFSGRVPMGEKKRTFFIREEEIFAGRVPLGKKGTLFIGVVCSCEFNFCISEDAKIQDSEQASPNGISPLTFYINWTSLVPGLARGPLVPKSKIPNKLSQMTFPFNVFM